jgi:serine/threonine-protein kinase
MTNMELQRESLFSANLDTVPQKEATTSFDADWARQLPRRIAPHLVARKVLGEGGTAIVFGAFHTRLKLQVAVKILKLEGESSSEAALRMHREAELCARLDSPRFPRIYDVDTLPDGTPYVVMEEVHGRPLDELLSHGPLDLDLAVAIVCEVLEGLCELHAAGVIHRDIKPSNLILEEDPSGSFRVRMLDLGIAKSMNDANSPDPLGSHPGVSLTQRGCLLGTPHYMSSEQLMGAPVDQRTDLYSVGVLLYEILSGRLPFQGETAGSVIAAALRDVPESIRVLRPDLPEELEYIVTKAMDRDRAQRFSSASEMLIALRGLSPQRLSTRPQPRGFDSALRAFDSSLQNFDDLPTSELHRPAPELHVTDSAQQWAARALHSVPPEPPKPARLWASRGVLAACAVLAGVVAWPTVTGRPERHLEARPAPPASASPVAAAPFVPALTAAPRSEQSVALEHVDLLRKELAIAPFAMNLKLATTPSADDLSQPKPTAHAPAEPEGPQAPQTLKVRPLRQPDSTVTGSSLQAPAPAIRPSTDENASGGAGVSLNTYVEELDRWLEPATQESSAPAQTPELPENPYQ